MPASTGSERGELIVRLLMEAFNELEHIAYVVECGSEDGCAEAGVEYEPLPDDEIGRLFVLAADAKHYAEALGEEADRIIEGLPYLHLWASDLPHRYPEAARAYRERMRQEFEDLAKQFSPDA